MTTVLMAPEIIQDIGDVPWIREANMDEWEVFKADHPKLGSIDASGRPYFAMAVDTAHPECPENLRQKVITHLRIRWLD